MIFDDRQRLQGQIKPTEKGDLVAGKWVARDSIMLVGLVPPWRMWNEGELNSALVFASGDLAELG